MQDIYMYNDLLGVVNTFGLDCESTKSNSESTKANI